MFFRHLRPTRSRALLAILLLPVVAPAAPARSKDDSPGDTPSGKPPEILKIKEALEETESFPGVIAVHRDTVSGALLIHLKPEHLERAFIQCTFVQDHALNPRVLDRITDSALHGGDYSVAALGADLTDALFADDAAGSVSTAPHGLQTGYVERLATMLEKQVEPLSAVNRAMAVGQLQAIPRLMTARAPVDPSTDAHVAHLLVLISRALDRVRSSA